MDTKDLKINWTDEQYKLYETIPKMIRDIAGDLFELKWYSHIDGDKLFWELEHNILGTKAKAEQFMQKYKQLTTQQKNLIYYAYEA